MSARLVVVVAALAASCDATSSRVVGAGSTDSGGPTDAGTSGADAGSGTSGEPADAGGGSGGGTGDTSDAGSSSGSGTDGGSGSNGGILAYTVTDLGQGWVSSIDGQGRVAGNVRVNSGSPFGGAVYTPGPGWSAVPVPKGADLVEAIGIDANGNVGMNAWFPQPCIKCSIRHSYIGFPLRPVPFERHDFETSLINAVHPVTGHVVGYDEVLGGAYFYDGTVTPIAVQPGKTFDNEGPSQATALNLHDQVVGWMRPDPHPGTYNETSQHAFIWDRGKLIDLGGGTGAGGRAPPSRRGSTTQQWSSA